MKTVCLVFFLAFLVFQAKPNPLFTRNLKFSNSSESDAYQADEKGLPTTTRVGKISCLGPWGYCLLRNYWCVSGFVIKEKFNNCPNTRTLKCCVL